MNLWKKIVDTMSYWQYELVCVSRVSRIFIILLILFLYIVQYMYSLRQTHKQTFQTHR